MEWFVLLLFRDGFLLTMISLLAHSHFDAFASTPFSSHSGFAHHAQPDDMLLSHWFHLGLAVRPLSFPRLAVKVDLFSFCAHLNLNLPVALMFQSLGFVWGTGAGNVLGGERRCAKNCKEN